jgi:serine/threonine protein kinase
MNFYPPGSLIAGRYEVASRPMMGGMGIVYFCMDHDENHPVALKTFRPEFLSSRDIRDRFLREGATWVKLGNHPHIVRCYEVRYIDPTAFLSLELVSKEQEMPDASLRSWLIPNHPLPIEQSLLFALQIARGLQHATEKIPGFVHRDLKPENVLVGADRLSNTNINRLRVTDFGLVAILQNEIKKDNDESKGEDKRRAQLTGGVVGTPLYMAPEQWKGEKVGVFTDVYALGCVLSEMITGQYAVDGETTGQLQKAHCAGKLRALPNSLNRDIKSLLTKCLALKPSDRYETWSELTDAIERAYIKQSGISAPHATGSKDVSLEELLRSGWSFNEMGLAYLDIGNAIRSTYYFEQAIAISREIGDRFGEGNSLGNIGIAYKDLGDTHRAIKYHKKHLVIANEIGDRRGEASALSNLGNAFSDQRDAHQAIGYYEQALAINRELGDLRREGNALNGLGNALLLLGEARQAIGYSELALEIAREVGDKRGEGYSLNGLGVAYDQLGEALRAIEYFEKALVIQREIADPREVGNLLGNLGNANRSLGNARRAIGYYEEHLEISRNIGDKNGELTELSNIGAAYHVLGDLERAFQYYELCLSIAHEAGHLNVVATVSFNMALLSEKQDNFARALSLAQKAMQIWSQIDSPHTLQAQNLVEKLQNGEDIDALPRNSSQEAFEAFQHCASFIEMKTVVTQFPFMTTDSFIDAVEEIIVKRVPPEYKAELNKRLTWLRRIAKE